LLAHPPLYTPAGSVARRAGARATAQQPACLARTCRCTRRWVRTLVAWKLLRTPKLSRLLQNIRVRSTLPVQLVTHLWLLGEYRGRSMVHTGGTPIGTGTPAPPLSGADGYSKVGQIQGQGRLQHPRPRVPEAERERGPRDSAQRAARANFARSPQIRRSLTVPVRRCRGQTKSRPLVSAPKRPCRNPWARRAMQHGSACAGAWRSAGAGGSAARRLQRASWHSGRGGSVRDRLLTWRSSASSCHGWARRYT